MYCRLRYSVTFLSFNPLMPGGNKRTYMFKQTCSFYMQICLSRVEKNRGPRGRGSHEVKTSRTNCGPGSKKYYRRENICSETKKQNVQNENIYRCVTYIYIYILVRQKVL